MTVQFLEVLAIALALSLDAFAVSFAASTAGYTKDKRAVFRLSFHFGLFQFLMPIVGWALGVAIEPIIAAFDHWIAFFLLAIVGLRMIRSALHPDAETQQNDPSRGITLVMLAIATSIDALAVGLSMAMLNMDVWYPSIVIGIVAGGMSVLAIVGGNRVGDWMGRRAQLVGGIVLVLIGVRIVITHMT
jgi:manganese efflux pump family protein